MRVLVTDAGFKNSLSAIRNLAMHGVEVIAAAPSKLSQGFFSRFCTVRAICPPPEDDQAFLDWLLSTIRAQQIDVVLPIGDEFRERIAFGGPHEKFRKCLAQRVCNDKLRWRDAGTNGPEPGPERVPNELGRNDREILE